MKIADIQVGMEVGVLRRRKADYRELPRQAEVVEIVTIEEKRWDSMTGKPITPRKVRQVRIQLTTDPLVPGSTWNRGVHNMEKGAILTVDPATIAAPWSELKDDILKRVAKREAKIQGQAALVARVEALLGKKRTDEYVHVRYEGRANSNEVEFYGPALEEILRLAELGRSEC